MSTTPSLVDVLTIVSFLCVWSTTVIGLVWWLNTKFNQLLPSQTYYEKHEQVENRVRLIEIKLAKLCQKVLNGEERK